jgi:hypothetical protein
MPIKIESVSTIEKEEFEQQPDEGVQENPERIRIYTRFRTVRRPPNDRVVIRAAILYLDTPFLTKPWKQELSPKSFEIMHGLTRVTKLTPDKLATALAINKENLPDPDDGGFLIGLVIDLVTFYRDKLAQQVQQEEGTESTMSRVVNFGTESQQILTTTGESIGILEVLNGFLCKMTLLQVNLSQRNEEGINAYVHQILQMADDILEFSTAYLEFLNPLYLDIERRGFFDERKIRELKSNLLNELIKNKKRIQLEFDSLINPRESES